jgi:hypothetical protein
MNTALFIRRFIFSLPKGKIFTTRECLIYGLRGAVDQALYRLVKKEVIFRLARGIFVRNQELIPEFTPFDIAKIKAKAFGKEIITHTSQLAQKLGMDNQPYLDHVFATNGDSSSFRFGEITIHMKHAGPRNLKLGDSKAGQTARFLWDLGKGNVHIDIIKKTVDLFPRSDREELRMAQVYMPAWLSAHFWLNHRWVSPVSLI